ncbi:MAG: DUF2157 domain-containing protein [Acidobacteriota bacterium]|nr:DUF2157 domain-containing protein [Acidobacteriota bacterium]
MKGRSRADSTTQQDAQRRVDRIRAFRDELAHLADEDILTLPEDESRRLAVYHDTLVRELSRRFDVDTSDAQKRMSWGMRLASFLGAVALCASVWFFFHSIWGSLTTPVQVGLPIAGTLAALGLTELFARIERSGYLAGLTGLIALACFVLDLVVIGNVFNIAPTENALLAWGALGLILAYGYGLRVPLTAGLLLVMGFAVAKAGTLQGYAWVDPLWRLPEYSLATGLVTFVVPLALRHRALTLFPPMYRLFGGLAVLSATLVLGFWGEGSFFTRLDPDSIEEAYQLAGLFLSGAAIAIGLWRSWTETVNLGGAFFFVFLFVKFFDWWWDWMPKWIFFLIFGLTALASLLLIMALRRRLTGRPA